VNGDAIVVWKVRHEDEDREEMTASEIAHWKAPAEDVQALKMKLKSKPARPKTTVATKPSGDRPEESEDALPKPGKDASAPTWPSETVHASPTTSVGNSANEFPGQQSTPANGFHWDVRSGDLSDSSV